MYTQRKQGKKIAEIIMAELGDKDKIDMKESSPNAYSIYTVTSVFNTLNSYRC